MVKKNLIRNGFAVIGVIAVLGVLTQAVSNSSIGFENRDAEVQEQARVLDSLKKVVGNYTIHALPIPDEMEFAGEKVPLEDTDVYRRMDRELLVNAYWQSNGLLMLKRAYESFPVIEPILERYGIPDDFKYLAVAESALLDAVSPAGAKGVWQFMESTGREYGLEINSNVDERYNLVKSTEAACRYLQKSKEKFGSWTLAAAAYNAGRSGIINQQDRQKTADYYDLLLNPETARYVFRILALKEVMQHPEKYGFSFTDEDLYDPIPTFTVAVDTAISDLPDFARGYGISYKTLKIHNPWLRETHLKNSSRKKYAIEIPAEGYYRNL